MNTALRMLAFVAVGCTATIGRPAHAASGPAGGAQVICASTNFQYSYCRVGVGGARVGIVEQLSRAPCVEGRSWGYDNRGIWVSNGCAARFAYSNRVSAGDVVGAAVVGGVIGAILGSASSDHRSHTTYNYYDHADPYPRPYPVVVEHRVIVDRRRDTSQDTDYSVQKFDKDGNPNYDTHGNYQGAHGVGALVDNPDTDNADSNDSNSNSDDGDSSD